MEAVSSKDGEAVLEFHYAPAAESLQQNKRRKADIERENHFKPTLVSCSYFFVLILLVVKFCGSQKISVNCTI